MTSGIQKSAVSKNAKIIAKRRVGAKFSQGQKAGATLVPATTKLQKERQDDRREMVIIILGKARCQGLLGMRAAPGYQCPAKVKHDFKNHLTSLLQCLSLL